MCIGAASDSVKAAQKEADDDEEFSSSDSEAYLTLVPSRVPRKSVRKDSVSSGEEDTQGTVIVSSSRSLESDPDDISSEEKDDPEAAHASLDVPSTSLEVVSDHLDSDDGEQIGSDYDSSVEISESAKAGSDSQRESHKVKGAVIASPPTTCLPEKDTVEKALTAPTAKSLDEDNKHTPKSKEDKVPGASIASTTEPLEDVSESNKNKEGWKTVKRKKKKKKKSPAVRTVTKISSKRKKTKGTKGKSKTSNVTTKGMTFPPMTDQLQGLPPATSFEPDPSWEEEEILNVEPSTGRPDSPNHSDDSEADFDDVTAAINQRNTQEKLASLVGEVPGPNTLPERVRFIEAFKKGAGHIHGQTTTVPRGRGRGRDSGRGRGRGRGHGRGQGFGPGSKQTKGVPSPAVAQPVTAALKKVKKASKSTEKKQTKTKGGKASITSGQQKETAGSSPSKKSTDTQGKGKANVEPNTTTQNPDLEIKLETESPLWVRRPASSNAVERMSEIFSYFGVELSELLGTPSAKNKIEEWKQETYEVSTEPIVKTRFEYTRSDLMNDCIPSWVEDKKPFTDVHPVDWMRWSGVSAKDNPITLQTLEGHGYHPSCRQLFVKLKQLPFNSEQLNEIRNHPLYDELKKMLRPGFNRDNIQGDAIVLYRCLLILNLWKQYNYRRKEKRALEESTAKVTGGQSSPILSPVVSSTKRAKTKSSGTVPATEGGQTSTSQSPPSIPTLAARGHTFSTTPGSSSSQRQSSNRGKRPHVAGKHESVSKKARKEKEQSVSLMSYLHRHTWGTGVHSVNSYPSFGTHPFSLSNWTERIIPFSKSLSEQKATIFFTLENVPKEEQALGLPSYWREFLRKSCIVNHSVCEADVLLFKDDKKVSVTRYGFDMHRRLAYIREVFFRILAQVKVRMKRCKEFLGPELFEILFQRLPNLDTVAIYVINIALRQLLRSHVGRPCGVCRSSVTNTKLACPLCSTYLCEYCTKVAWPDCDHVHQNRLVSALLYRCVWDVTKLFDGIKKHKAELIFIMYTFVSILDSSSVVGTEDHDCDRPSMMVKQSAFPGLTMEAFQSDAGFFARLPDIEGYVSEDTKSFWSQPVAEQAHSLIILKRDYKGDSKTLMSYQNKGVTVPMHIVGYISFLDAYSNKNPYRHMILNVISLVPLTGNITLMFSGHAESHLGTFVSQRWWNPMPTNISFARRALLSSDMLQSTSTETQKAGSDLFGKHLETYLQKKPWWIKSFDMSNVHKIYCTLLADREVSANSKTCSLSGKKLEKYLKPPELLEILSSGQTEIPSEEEDTTVPGTPDDNKRSLQTVQDIVPLVSPLVSADNEDLINNIVKEVKSRLVAPFRRLRTKVTNDFTLLNNQTQEALKKSNKNIMESTDSKLETWKSDMSVEYTHSLADLYEKVNIRSTKMETNIVKNQDCFESLEKAFKQLQQQVEHLKSSNDGFWSD